MNAPFVKHAVIIGIALALALTDIASLVAPFPPFQSEAQARVGRPLTPGSVAGVARRTTRRVIRRSTIYVATLPASCSSVTINGIGGVAMRRHVLPAIRRSLRSGLCRLKHKAVGPVAV